MILEFHNYIDNDFADHISNECKKYITTKQTMYNRDGYTVNISEDPKLKEIDSELHSIMDKINKEILVQRYKPLFNSADTGYEYHLYNPGDICHHHSDGEITNSNFLRYASVVLQLTTNKDGGELIFPAQNKAIKTEKGKLVIFPPYGMYSHYVTPSSTAREVIVSWFIYDGVVVNKPF